MIIEHTHVLSAPVSIALTDKLAKSCSLQKIIIKQYTNKNSINIYLEGEIEPKIPT